MMVGVVITPIHIQLEWDMGKVVTETITTYKEVEEDANFEGFSPTSMTDAGNKKNSVFSSLKGGWSSSKKADANDSSSDEGDLQTKFEEESLNVHNQYRKKHNADKLKLSIKLCRIAQEWADKLAKDDSFQHCPDNQYGENLYCTYSSNPKAKCSGKTPVESWYSEISKYMFGEEPRSMGTGHFTQVVWKGSKEMGIAKAKTKSGKIIVVANYDPPGNYIGQYTKNVMAPN